MAADPELPDFHDLQLELIRLERAEADTARRHAIVSERHGAFPSDFTRAQERQLAANLAAIRGRIEVRQAQLLPIRRRLA
jgi:hypothetical protein